MTRRRRWFEPLAMFAIGAVVVAAALIPAVTANSGETITVRGDVRLHGEPLAFFPVGFWAPVSGVVADTRTRTDANGGFTMDVPVTLDGYAFAGTAPDAERAIVTVGGRQVVRGIIGGNVAKPISTPLYQGWTMATGRQLAGGADRIHFLLQEPGRIGGTAPIVASRIRAVQVRRLDGSVVQTLDLDRRRRFRSQLLAPGDYAVALVPTSPDLPVVLPVTVTAATTTTARLPVPTVGAVVSGTVSMEDGAAGAGIPVLLTRGGETVRASTTSTGGAYRFAGVPVGDYTVEAGRYDRAAAVPVSAVAVPIPGATSTPTPTPTPTATPSATPPALEPVERTADAVLPASAAVVVSAALGEVVAPIDAQAAGRVSGTVTAPAAAAGATAPKILVLVEDTTTGRIIRSTTAAADGRYSFGGLVQGDQYEIRALTEPDDPALAVSGAATALATASTTQVDVRLDDAAATVSGTVAGATSGTVVFGTAGVFQRSASIDSSGAYAVQGLAPGAYPVVVRTPKRLASEPVAVDVPDPASAAAAATAPASVDLQPGPLPAAFEGWFISGGAGVRLVSGTASGDEGIVRFGPRTDLGRVRITGLAPGTYTYDGFQGTAPTLDGPWFFLAPTGTFSLSAGSTTDVDAIVLHVRAR